MTTVHDFTAQDITGATIPLSTYQGKVLLIVNTASKCGFTPQYQGLQRLQKDLADRGFTVLGFPYNQFSHQETSDAIEIADFCKIN
jgi:glutathione peroxidase